MDPHLKDTGPYIHFALLILYLLSLSLLILYGNLEGIALFVRSEQQVQETDY